MSLLTPPGRVAGLLLILYGLSLIFSLGTVYLSVGTGGCVDPTCFPFVNVGVWHVLGAQCYVSFLHSCFTCPLLWVCNLENIFSPKVSLWDLKYAHVEIL